MIGQTNKQSDKQRLQLYWFQEKEFDLFVIDEAGFTPGNWKIL